MSGPGTGSIRNRTADRALLCVPYWPGGDEICANLAVFDTRRLRLYADGMEVHLSPELQAKLDKLATDTGRSQEEFVEDAMAGYLNELGQVRGMHDSRYDDIKSGRVKPIDGDQAFARLREKSDNRRSGRTSVRTSNSGVEREICHRTSGRDISLRHANSDFEDQLQRP